MRPVRLCGHACLRPRGNLRHRFDAFLKATGVPRVRFHDLRHGVATFLYASGVPIKVIAEMLGHADVATTLRTYAHVAPGMQGVALAALDGWLGDQDTGRPRASGDA